MRIIEHRFIPAGFVNTGVWLAPERPRRIEPYSLFKFRKQPIVNNSEKHEIKVDCEGFKRESMQIELSEDKTKLIVFAREGERSPAGNGQEADYSLKEFRRSFKLPENVDVTGMKHHFTDDNTLLVEIPFKRMEIKPQPNRNLVPNYETFVDENGRKSVRLSLNMPEMIDADKIRVVCKNRDVIVRAEDTYQSNDGVNQIFFYKRTTLPENTNFDSLKCLYDQNKLNIVAKLNDPSGDDEQSSTTKQNAEINAA